MNKTRTKALLITCVGAFIIGCSPSPKTATIDALVGEIVKHAATDDTAFFAQHMDESAKHQATQLIKQIKASEMVANFKDRIEDDSDAKARLNYHYLEKGCHLQIDLEKQDGLWAIRRIWFCR